MAYIENKFTESEVLAHAGVGGTFHNERVDNARAMGLIYICLGCATVGGIDPEGDLLDHPTVEAARAATRDALDPDWLCCPDADQIIY